MKHFHDENGQTSEELYEPTIKHFSQGNNESPAYDKSVLNHDDDEYVRYINDGESTIHHFQD